MTFTHGTDSGYTNRCRLRPGGACAACRAAHSAYHKQYKRALRARRFAAGLNAEGQKRTRPYEAAALELMAEFGLEPDPRYVWRPQ